MSSTPLHPGTIARELLLAVAIGAVVWLPIWLCTGPLVEWFAPTTHHYWGTFRLESAPDDDTALAQWLRERGADAVSVERTGGGIEIELRTPAKFALDVPWDAFGYEGLTGRSSGWISSGPLRLGWAFYVFLLARLSALGLLVVAVRRARAAGASWLARMKPTRPARDALLAIGVALAALAIGIAWSRVPELFGGTARGIAGTWSLAAVLPAWEGWLILATMTLAAPPCEESYFRGRILAGAGSPRGAAAASVGLFALFRADPTLLPVQVALGCGLVWLARRTGSLFAPIVSHAVFNAASIGTAIGIDGRELLGQLLGTAGVVR